MSAQAVLTANWNDLQSSVISTAERFLDHKVFTEDKSARLPIDDMQVRRSAAHPTAVRRTHEHRKRSATKRTTSVQMEAKNSVRCGDTIAALLADGVFKGLVAEVYEAEDASSRSRPSPTRKRIGKHSPARTRSP